MRLFITSDCHWESRVDRVLSELSDEGIEERFESTSYGDGVRLFRIVVMCRRPEIEFHRRRRYQPGPAIFGMDVLLPFEPMRDATMEERRHLLAEGLCSDVQMVFAQRKVPILNFDAHAFVADLRREFRRIGWLEKLKPKSPKTVKSRARK